MTVVRAATGILVALTLTSCAGEQFSVGSSAPPQQATEFSMPGRWMLTAPNAPSCGLEFNGTPGAHAGTIAPDGGCPGNFYLSRRWAMEGGALTIADRENQALAQLKFVGTYFEGQSTAGTNITLAR